jgi:hypothetical protein
LNYFQRRQKVLAARNVGVERTSNSGYCQQQLGLTNRISWAKNWGVTMLKRQNVSKNHCFCSINEEEAAKQQEKNLMLPAHVSYVSNK